MAAQKFVQSRAQRNQGHLAAVATYLADHGADTRTAKAMERRMERSKLSPEQQLTILDCRLGRNRGAVQERARLNALVDSDVDIDFSVDLQQMDDYDNSNGYDLNKYLDDMNDEGWHDAVSSF